MKPRILLTAVLALGVAGLAQAVDIVYYHDRASKKEQDHRGTIEDESPAGIRIKVREGKDQVVKEVPADAITQVEYEVKDVYRRTYRNPSLKVERALKESGKRRRKSLADALEGYTQLEGQVRSVPNARRHVQYKMAEVSALIAQDDPSQAEAAIKRLSDFRSGNMNSWQIVSALKLLARLQEVSGKPDDAAKSYEALADLPDIPATLKQQSALLVGRLLLRGGKYAEAEKRLKGLAGKMSATDELTPLVRAYLAECRIGQNSLDGVEKELGGLIKGHVDARLRGVAHNLLGDYYAKKNQQDEAFWNYLRVDALYPEDAEEQAKALYHLAGLFDKLKKDPLRGKECSARLMEPRFAGTTFQRKLVSEAKKE